MLQTAAQRLSRTSLAQSAQDPPLSLSPSAEQRSPRLTTRRLSKISASEFDSVLSAGDTVRIKSREPDLGDPAAEQTATDATTALPARQGSSRDLVDAAGSLGDISDSDKQAPQVVSDLTGGGIRRIETVGNSSGSTDPAGTSPAFDMTSTTGTSTGATHYESLVTVGAIDPVPVPRSRRNSTAPPADNAIPVTFPSRSTDARPPPMIHQNASNSTLATAFGLSPRRRRVQSDETIQERVRRRTPSSLMHSGTDLCPRARSPLWAPCARRAGSFASSAPRATQTKTRSAPSYLSAATNRAR